MRFSLLCSLCVVCMLPPVVRAQDVAAAGGNAAALPPPPSRAAHEVPSAGAIGYQEALARAEAAPELRARAQAVTRLRAQSERVSALPGDFTLSSELGPQLAPDRGLQGRIGVAQSFALRALGAARSGVLRSDASAFDAERAAAVFERRVAAAQAWLQAWFSRQALGVARQERDLADQLSRLSVHAAELGELTRADAADAEVYAAEAGLDVLAAEGALVDARFELASALDEPDGSFDVRGNPPAPLALSPTVQALLRARIERSPQLAALLSQQAVLAARARETRALYGPQLALGVVADRSDPQAFAALGTVSLSLPLTDRALRERAELEADRTLLDGRLRQARVRARLLLERWLHELEHAQAALQHTERKLLPAIDAGLSARDALFRAGEGSVLEVVVAHRTALRERVRHLRLAVDVALASARLSELARALGVEP